MCPIIIIMLQSCYCCHDNTGPVPIFCCSFSPRIGVLHVSALSPHSRTLSVFGICWPDPIAPNQQQEEKGWMWMGWGQETAVCRHSAAGQNLTDGFLSPPESVRATASTLRWLCLSLCFAVPCILPFPFFTLYPPKPKRQHLSQFSKNILSPAFHGNSIDKYWLLA